MPTARPKPRPRPIRHAVSDQLREVILARGLSAYAVAREADLDPGVVARFLSRTRGLTLDSVDRIAAVLDLRLVEATPRRGKGRARAADVAPPAAGDGPPNAANAASTGG